MTFTTAKDFATLRDISDEEEESDDCDDLDGHNSIVSGHSSNLSGSNLSGSSTSAAAHLATAHQAAAHLAAAHLPATYLPGLPVSKELKGEHLRVKGICHTRRHSS